LENLDAEVNIDRVLETIRENIKISAKESLDFYCYGINNNQNYFCIV
jgi:hypothetical protein